MTTETIEPTDAIVEAPTLMDGAAPAAAPAAAEGEADTLLGSATDGEKPAEEKAAAPAVPETYEIQLEDGQALDAEALEVVDPILRELGLDNEQANKLAKAWPGLQEKMAARFAAQSEEAQITELNRLSTEWEGASIADPEIGGAPEVMGPKMALAAKARDKFASPELRQLLTSTRLANHPEVIRLFHKVGVAISESSFVRGDAAAPPAPKADWEKMYPHMTQTQT